MTTDDRLARFQRLQDALDRGQEAGSYLRQLQPYKGAVERATLLRDGYLTWYTATRALLPADLRDRFVVAYEGEALNPRLRFYLDHASEENPDPGPTPPQRRERWRYPYASYDRFMREQLALVAEARRRSMDTPSAIPAALKPLIAQPFGGRKHSVLTVDGMFVGAGAQRAWCLKQAQEGYHGGQKTNRVWCWLDGIRLHAPEQEYPIVAAVCRTLMAQNLVGAATGQQMEALLAQARQAQTTPAPERAHPAVSGTPPPAPPSAPTAQDIPINLAQLAAEERQHDEALLHLHQQRLRQLELQVAAFGPLHVPTHLQLAVEHELAAIARLQALLAPPSVGTSPADVAASPVRLVDDDYYPALLQRYAITIVRMIDPTTFLIRCNYCEGAGKRPHTVANWKVTQRYTAACGVCHGNGVVTVRVTDTLIPHARCEGSGKARPNMQTRDIKVCSGCNGLGVQSATGTITVVR